MGTRWKESAAEPRPDAVWGLQTCADREALLLAPYAMHSADSRGREHAESQHPYRGPFQRDRDRIVHSSAWRRLSGKTQVFTGVMGDYHRTRLTHTHEVASIARTLGRALRLNEDLVEALALFHDIGHPPFGHAGEDALDECLADEGGFSHNRYALTIACELEHRYQSFPGLNLSQEVLEGQQARVDKQAGGAAPLLEAQVVDAADSISYDAHDTDDAVKLGLVTLDELAELPLVREARRRAQEDYGPLAGKMLRKALVHELIDMQVSDVLGEAVRLLREAAPASASAARQLRSRIGPGRRLQDEKQQLEDFLYQRVYRHPQLVRVRHAAQRRLRQLLEHLSRHPHELPEKFRQRAGQLSPRRAAGDYIAGMTDRFFDQQYALCFPTSGGAVQPSSGH